MASASLVPKNGSIVLGTYTADFNAFTVRAAQAVEGATPFGSNFLAKNVGSGTPSVAWSIAACGLAHGTGNKPGLDGAGANIFAPTGLASSVFTMDTGITFTFTATVAEWSIGTARMRAIQPVAISGANYGDITEAWSVT